MRPFGKGVRNNPILTTLYDLNPCNQNHHGQMRSSKFSTLNPCSSRWPGVRESMARRRTMRTMKAASGGSGCVDGPRSGPCSMAHGKK